MKDPPPSMHVIAFSDLDHFLRLLVCSSGDVTHHCTTLMTEFHSKCDNVLDWDTVWAEIIIAFGRTKLYKMGWHVSFFCSVC